MSVGPTAADTTPWHPAAISPPDNENPRGDLRAEGVLGRAHGDQESAVERGAAEDADLPALKEAEGEQLAPEILPDVQVHDGPGRAEGKRSKGNGSLRLG